MKIFISQPMRGISREEILEERERIKQMFSGNEFIDSFIEDIPEMEGNTRVWCLGESIKKMKDAELVIVPVDGYYYSGCHIESEVADMYGIPKCRIDMYPHKERDATTNACCEAVR